MIRFGDSQGGTAKGSYGIQFPTDVTNCVAIGSIGETTGNGMAPGQITVRTDGHANANAANFADVVTYNSAGTPTDLPFNVAASAEATGGRSRSAPPRRRARAPRPAAGPRPATRRRRGTRAEP